MVHGDPLFATLISSLSPTSSPCSCVQDATIIHMFIPESTNDASEIGEEERRIAAAAKE